MRIIKETDLQEVQQGKQKEEQLPINVDNLGSSIVKEKLARLAAEKKNATMGKMIVQSRLVSLRK